MAGILTGGICGQFKTSGGLGYNSHKGFAAAFQSLRRKTWGSQSGVNAKNLGRCPPYKKERPRGTRRGPEAYTHKQFSGARTGAGDIGGNHETYHEGDTGNYEFKRRARLQNTPRLRGGRQRETNQGA